MAQIIITIPADQVARVMDGLAWGLGVMDDAGVLDPDPARLHSALIALIKKWVKNHEADDQAEIDRVARESGHVPPDVT